jgi:hypothetical protein
MWSNSGPLRAHAIVTDAGRGIWWTRQRQASDVMAWRVERLGLLIWGLSSPIFKNIFVLA